MARKTRLKRRSRRIRPRSHKKKRARKSRRSGLILWGKERIARGADARTGESKRGRNGNDCTTS